MSDAPLCVSCRRRPVDPRWRPFCRERCKLTDLGRWLTGEYRVRGTPEELPAAGVDAPDDAADQDT